MAQRWLPAPAMRCALVAEGADGIVGMIGGAVGEMQFSRARAATIMLYGVDPDHRGGLAAIKLLHGFRRWARSAGAATMILPVTSGDGTGRTDRMLRRLGFGLIGGKYAIRLPPPGHPERTSAP